MKKIIEHLDDEGTPHNELGPAIVYLDGSREYYWHGERHRIDGPAVIKSDGTTRYYLFDQAITQMEHEYITKHCILALGLKYMIFHAIQKLRIQSKTFQVGYIDPEEYEKVKQKLPIDEMLKFDYMNDKPIEKGTW